MPGKAGEKLGRAIITKLQSVSALTSLLGHSPSNIRIGIGMPNVKGLNPYLAVMFSIFPYSPNYPRIYRGLVDFVACSSNPHKAVQVADELLLLFAGDGITPDHLRTNYFWDPSATGITFRSFSFVSREEPKFDTDLDIYTISTVANTIFLDFTCEDINDEPVCP